MKLYYLSDDKNLASQQRSRTPGHLISLDVLRMYTSLTVNIIIIISDLYIKRMVTVNIESVMWPFSNWHLWLPPESITELDIGQPFSFLFFYCMICFFFFIFANLQLHWTLLYITLQICNRNKYSKKKYIMYSNSKCMNIKLRTKTWWHISEGKSTKWKRIGIGTTENRTAR